MPPILNASAIITCCHGSGMVAVVPSQAKVLVGGAPALTAGDVAPGPVAGCPVVPSPGSKPCTTATVTPVPGGSVSTKVMIGGKPAMVSAGTLVGITDGVPAPCPTLMVQFPGQTKVMAT